MSAKLCERTRVTSLGFAAEGIFELALDSPRIAAATRPGQFVHVRVTGPSVQFLRMPFAVCDVGRGSDAGCASDGAPQTIELCVQVVGAGTAQLSELEEGDYLDVMGPIGTGWSVPAGTARALLVGGGVGTPALNLLARALADAGILADAVIGAQTAQKLCLVERISEILAPVGGTLHITTDDGTAGTHGFVTAVTGDLVASGAYDYVAVCGPEPMMRSVAVSVVDAGITCQVSAERLMACGVGACLSCVIETTSGKRRCCVDGPVFDAREVVW